MIIEADSLVDLLIEEINYRLVIEADSLVAREREVDRFTGRQSDESRYVIALTKSVIEADSLVDLLIKEIDYRLVIEADSLVAREREVDRFTDRQSDESRYVIALTKSVIEADSLIHELSRRREKEIEQIVFTRLLHENGLILKQFTKILYRRFS